MNVTVELLTNEEWLRAYYVYLAMRAYTGWYQARKFLILPELIPGLLNSVVLPRSQWIKDKRILEKLSDEGFTEQENFFNIRELVSDIDQVDIGDDWLNDVSKIQDQLPDIQEAISKTLDYMGGMFNLPGKNARVLISPLSIGTMSSFDIRSDGELLEFIITLRSDIPWVYIIDGLISTLVAKTLMERRMEWEVSSWQLREEIGEFLLYHSKIAEVVDLGEHRKTVASLYSDEFQKIEYRERSQSYLKELGFPLGEAIRIDWEKLQTQLSGAEYRLAKALYDHKGSVVNYDLLAENLYGENWQEKFSLEYLAKVIEQVRKKLQSSGYGQTIYTQRGVGYGWWE